LLHLIPNRLRLLDGRTVKIGTLGSHWDIEDVEGTYAVWMGSIDAIYFILRPDFYVAASASSAADLNRRFDEVIDELHLKTA